MEVEACERWDNRSGGVTWCVLGAHSMQRPCHRVDRCLNLEGFLRWLSRCYAKHLTTSVGNDRSLLDYGAQKLSYTAVCLSV
jgi:hypothetical protein